MRKDIFDQIEEKSCVFKPEISSKKEPGIIKEVKGMKKFLTRQKLAKDTKKELEMERQKDLGKNWVRHTTIPKEFHFNKVIVSIIKLGKLF